MKSYYKFFYIFAIVSFVILTVKEVLTYAKKEQAQDQFLILQSETIVSFINSFREVYKSDFLKYHIKIDKKTVHLIPIKTLPKILENFSKKIAGKVEVRLILDNDLNKEEIKIVKYFQTSKKDKYIIKTENKFLYYKPFYVKPNSLKCKYPKTKDSYKTGELRGVIEIKIYNSQYTNLIDKNFYNRMLMDYLLYLITLGIVWILIKRIDDINEKYTKKLLEINQQLQVEKFNAEKNEKAKGEFLANMSHEIRTPLNAMIGFIKLLEEKKLDEESKRYLSIVEKSGNILLNVINDILDVSKIESGKIQIENIPFNPKEEIEHIYYLFKEKASEKGVNLYIKEENLDYDIIADPTRIKQIISNLLSNAIKFTPEGQNIYLNIKYDDKKEKLCVEIKDEGIGIDTTKLITIFAPFSQEDTSTTRKYGGTGLGLTISHELVKLLGGELRVKSKKNEGSIFYFTIPAKKARKIQLQKKENLLDTFNYTVLMVEDNKANQMFLEIILKKLGLKFDIANDGIEAVELYKKNYQKYDLILMDENMPNMSGREATAEIRAFEKDNYLDEIYIVAVTANALGGDREKFLEAGMNDYISKPIDVEKLKEIFRRFNEYINNRGK